MNISDLNYMEAVTEEATKVQGGDFIRWSNDSKVDTDQTATARGGNNSNNFATNFNATRVLQNGAGVILRQFGLG